MMTLVPMNRLAETVRALRERRGWTMGQLAAYADLTTGYISKLEGGKVASPAYDVLQRLAHALRVDVDTLAGGAAPPERDTRDLLREALARLDRERAEEGDAPLRLPLASQPAAAGNPTEVDAYSFLPLPGERGHRYAAIEVRGRCLEPPTEPVPGRAYAYHGEVAIVDYDASPRHGDIVLAEIAGEGTVFRRYCTNGHPRLESEQHHDPVAVEGEAVRVLGVARMFQRTAR